MAAPKRMAACRHPNPFAMNCLHSGPSVPGDCHPTHPRRRCFARCGSNRIETNARQTEPKLKILKMSVSLIFILYSRPFGNNMSIGQKGSVRVKTFLPPAWNFPRPSVSTSLPMESMGWIAALSNPVHQIQIKTPNKQQFFLYNFCYLPFTQRSHESGHLMQHLPLSSRNKRNNIGTIERSLHPPSNFSRGIKVALGASTCSTCNISKLQQKSPD